MIKKNRLDYVLAGLLVVMAIWLAMIMWPQADGQVYNQTAIVNTTVNISNAAPLVTDIAIPASFNLVAGSTAELSCNVTVYDYDNNTQEVNATFYRTNISSSTAPDQNYLYQNISCSMISPKDYYTNFSCVFNVNYYAYNGTWACNATASDSAFATNSNVSVSNTTITSLVAIKLSSIIDFGELAVNQVSNDTNASITNVGNRNINISVEGYGQNSGDGNAMVCSNGAIPIAYERFNITSATPFSSMRQLTGAMIPNYFIAQRTDDAQEMISYTYWKLQIPAGAAGICNGKVLFTASDRGI